MFVLDIDSHVVEPFDWVEQRFPELAARLPEPKLLEVLAEAVFGDLWANLPPAQRPDPLLVLPASFRPLAVEMAELSPSDLQRVCDESDESAMAATFRARGAHDMDERVRWMDDAGIDVEHTRRNNARTLHPNTTRQGVA